MKLTELDASFLCNVTANQAYLNVASIQKADGVMFQCPLCAKDAERTKDGRAFVGVHYVICWCPRVSPDINPKPGRWEFVGTGLHDLTLTAKSSSILLTSGCHAHFYIRKGEIAWA